jgi:hypothetical protein
MQTKHSTDSSFSHWKYIPKKKFCLSDALLILGVLFLSAALLSGIFLYRARNNGSESGLAAVLTIDGIEVWRQDLSGLEGSVEYTVTYGQKSLTVRADHLGASIYRSDCPDQICVRTGKLTEVGQTAVCIPLHGVLKIVPASDSTGKESGYADMIDAVSGNCGGLYEFICG